MQTIVYRIDGMPKDIAYNGMPFGRQLEWRHVIESFKKRSRSTHLSQKKRKSFKKAINEFVKLNQVKEWYCVVNHGMPYHDDSFEFWYLD